MCLKKKVSSSRETSQSTSWIIDVINVGPKSGARCISNSWWNIEGSWIWRKQNLWNPNSFFEIFTLDIQLRWIYKSVKSLGFSIPWWKTHHFSPTTVGGLYLTGGVTSKMKERVTCRDHSITSWWFQICFMFTPTWGNDPIWLICFKWVETTN